MIRKDKGIRNVCSTYEQVENYEKAIEDVEQLWELHHRREIDENKSMQQLIDEGKYFDVAPEELIFLTRSEHRKLHNEGKIASEAVRKKISERAKQRTGESNSMFGKHHSEAAKKEISEALLKEKNPFYKTFWWNNGKVAIRSKEQPGSDFVRGRLKSNK